MPRSEGPLGLRERLSWQQARAHLPELVRFAAVGISSAGVYFGLLWLFGWLTPLPLSLLAILAYGTGIIFNYLVQRSFTFRSSRQHHHAGPRYLLVQLAGMLINSAVLHLGVELAHWPFAAVQLAGIVLAAMFSYVGQKFWAFDGPRRQG